MIIDREKVKRLVLNDLVYSHSDSKHYAGCLANGNFYVAFVSEKTQNLCLQVFDALSGALLETNTNQREVIDLTYNSSFYVKHNQNKMNQNKNKKEHIL